MLLMTLPSLNLLSTHQQSIASQSLFSTPKMANTVQTLPLRYASIYSDTLPGTRLTENRTDYSKSFDVPFGTGASQMRIPVNREVATKRSAFFRAATSTRWTTDPSKPVDLQEHEPEVFRSYIRCIYFAWFDLPSATASRETVDRCYEALTKLYILTDKLGDVSTGNFVLSKIIRLSVLRLNTKRNRRISMPRSTANNSPTPLP